MSLNDSGLGAAGSQGHQAGGRMAMIEPQDEDQER